MQDPHGYKTTQENVVAFLSKTWTGTTAATKKIRAICFVATGIHDVAVPGITLEMYEKNVRWYLNLLDPLCFHIVWIYNTAPKTDNPEFKQRINQTACWNDAIGNIIKASQRLRIKSTIVNLFNATINHEHGDNIHMTNVWYQKLANTFTGTSL